MPGSTRWNRANRWISKTEDSLRGAPARNALNTVAGRFLVGVLYILVAYGLLVLPQIALYQASYEYRGYVQWLGLGILMGSTAVLLGMIIGTTRRIYSLGGVGNEH